MAGKPKQGIEYAGWSVTMFDSDDKIDLLLDACGWDGFGIYFYLCTRAFGGDGYYYKWGFASCASTARRMGGGIGSNTVKETVGHCLRIGLFDKGLFDRWGILTSRGIQRSYWRVLSGRRSKVVYREYWLLADDECQGLIKNSLESNHDLANDHVQPANDDVQLANGGKNSTVQNRTVQSFKNNPAEPVLSPTEELYRSKIGTVTDKIRKGLAELVSEDGETEVMSAIKIAAERGARNLGYIRGILRNRRKAETEQRKKNKFLDYSQRDDVDYDALEKELADMSMGGQNEER